MNNFEPINVRALIETDKTFDILKDKYKEIELDLVSWRENPTCECGNRVMKFFEELFQNEDAKNFINELSKDEGVENKKKQILEKFSQRKKVIDPNGPPPPDFTDYRGKVLVVGKNDEDWANLWNKIVEEKAVFRNFSIVETPEYLKVYFL
jgi:hypothetical protein